MKRFKKNHILNICVVYQISQLAVCPVLTDKVGVDLNLFQYILSYFTSKSLQQYICSLFLPHVNLFLGKKKQVINLIVMNANIDANIE